MRVVPRRSCAAASESQSALGSISDDASEGNNTAYLFATTHPDGKWDACMMATSARSENDPELDTFIAQLKTLLEDNVGLTRLLDRDELQDRLSRWAEDVGRVTMPGSTIVTEVFDKDDECRAAARKCELKVHGKTTVATHPVLGRLTSMLQDLRFW